MFTGIIQAVGRLAQRVPRGGDLRVYVDTGDFSLAGVEPGESIAVNGVCLTAATVEARGFWADVSRETLALTTLERMPADTPVNLERSLTLSQPLGGHLVSGHVDGVGRIASVRGDARSYRLTIEAPRPLAKYIARKGSIAVDGISLTVNTVQGAVFGLNIVPHTWEHTNLGHIAAGDSVNIEVDVVARYLERLLGGDNERGDDAVWASLPRRRGFLQADSE